MVRPYGVTPCMRAIELAVQQVCDREWLLHAHWHVFGEYIDLVIAVGNRPIEAGVTES